MPAPPTPEAEPPPDADLPTVPVRYLAGRYRLDRVLGRGAMGRVWAAHDESLNRWVAIKEVDFPAGTPVSEMEQVAERAMREARAIASVSDHHVVTIFDLLHLGRAPAIVMELLDARSLAQVLSQDGPIGDGGAATVGLGVAAGLLAAHAVGITHRDVKPGNVLLCRDGRIKLTDFGIARSVDENTLTATGLLLGSPAYISPEVASGHPATTLSDAWGLGALLFACVEGVPPFDQGTPLKTLISVVHDPVPPHPSSGRLSELISALLIKDPARRMTVGQAHQLLHRLSDDPTGWRLVTHVWRPPGSDAGGSKPASRSASGPASGKAGPTGLSQPELARPAPRPGAGSGRLGAGSPRPGNPRPGTGNRRPDAGVEPPGPGRPAHLTSGSGTRSTLAGILRPVAPDLPPPPWAGSSRALAALPSRSVSPTKKHRALIWVMALVIGLAAAVGGYFGVRTLARITAPTEHSAPVPVIATIGPEDLPRGVLPVR